MAITLNNQRQEPRTAFVVVNFSDLASGSAANAIKLPGGSVITGGRVSVLSAFNSATSDSIVVGDATTANRYLTSSSLASASGSYALTPTGFATTASQPYVKLTWTGVGAAPTAGQFRLEVTYYNLGVSEATYD